MVGGTEGGEHAERPGNKQGGWACSALGQRVVVLVVLQYLVISESGSRPKWK